MKKAAAFSDVGWLRLLRKLFGESKVVGYKCRTFCYPIDRDW